MKAAKLCIRARLPGFLHTFFARKQVVETAKKNAAQCISSNLKTKKVDFPLSIVFDQALQLLFTRSKSKRKKSIEGNC